MLDRTISPNFSWGLIMVRTLRQEEWFHADGYPIAVLRRDPQEPFGLHCHDFTEIVVVTGGTARHVIGQDSWTLAAGDVFVIGGERPHDYQEMRRLSLINILYDPARLRMDLQDLPSVAGYHALFTLEPAWRKRHQFRSRLRLDARELGTLVGCIEDLETELAGRAAGFEFLALAQFMRLIGTLARSYVGTKGTDTHAILRIAEAISHLEARFAETIRLEDLATIAHMSERSFARAFQAAMGSSPIAYLVQLRINKAADLLRHGDASITDVAFRVGFSDGNYFSRQFHRLMGMTPREYRKHHAPQKLCR